MNCKVNLILIFLTSASLSLFSCAPKVEDKKIPLQTLARGPHFHDTDLSQVHSNSFAQQAFSKAHIQKSTQQKAQVELIEAQLSIGQILKSKDWKNAGLNSYKDFARTTKFADLSAEHSIYLDIVDRQINKSVSKSISSAEQQLAKNLGTVTALVRALKEKYLLLTLESTLQEKLAVTEVFIKRITANVCTLNIMPEFKNLLIQQLAEKSKNLLAEAKSLDSHTMRATSITQSIQSIDAYVTNVKIPLADDQSKNLALGERLGQMVDNTSDAKSALKSLALVWSTLDAQQRIDYVQVANPSLYQFLFSKDDSQIESLITGDGNGIITTVALNIGVYPAIEKFGVENIKSLLNQKGKEFIANKVNEAAFNSLQTLGETIVLQIGNSVNAKRGDLSEFDKNLNSVLKTNMKIYFSQHDIDHFTGLVISENGRAADLSVQAQALRNKISLVRENDLLEPTDLLRNQFEVIEQTLQLTFYGQAPGATKVLSDDERIDLILHPTQQQFLSQPAQTGATTEVVLLNNQSEMLLTTAQLIRQLRDWEVSTFDKNLSSIRANQIITEFKMADLDRPFFAKPDLLALTLSVASETLKRLEGPESLLMLIDNNQHLVSMEDFYRNQGAPLALAAAADLFKGHRLSLVRTQDLARFQLALIEFYSATVSIEKTASEILRQTDGTQPSLLEQIITARKKLKVLIIAIANFTSNQLQQKNGFVVDQMELGAANVNRPDRYPLADQLLAIEALVRTYEMTDIDVYLWSALDIYYAMNSKMYNPNLKFYAAEGLSLNLEKSSDLDANTILTSYKSLLRLMPYLSADSQIQLQNIFSGWLKSI